VSTPLLVVITCLYGFTSLDLAIGGQQGLALMFFAYAVANVGLILATKGI
jgi:hypothetical protein